MKPRGLGLDDIRSAVFGLCIGQHAVVWRALSQQGAQLRPCDLRLCGEAQLLGHAGLPVSTSTAESAVESAIGDRFKKNRNMRWTNEGANALRHIRLDDLNG